MAPRRCLNRSPLTLDSAKALTLGRKHTTRARAPTTNTNHQILRELSLRQFKVPTLLHKNCENPGVFTLEPKRPVLQKLLLEKCSLPRQLNYLIREPLVVIRATLLCNRVTQRLLATWQHLLSIGGVINYSWTFPRWYSLINRFTSLTPVAQPKLLALCCTNLARFIVVLEVPLT